MKNQKLHGLLLATSCAMLFSIMTFAQNPSEIDADFGKNGFVLNDYVKSEGEIFNDMITLSDDRIVMVGYVNAANQDIIVARFKKDGTVDSTFGNNGNVVIDLSLGASDQALVVKEAANKKLLIGGITVGQSSWDAFVSRLNEDGTLDASFGDKGSGTTRLNAGKGAIAMTKDLHINSDKSILVAATIVNTNENTDFGLFKLTSGGGLDQTFGSSGSMLFDNAGGTEDINSMYVTSNGNILLAGYTSDGKKKGMVMRLTQYGTIDNSFNKTGKYIYSGPLESAYFNAVTVTPDNKVIVVGSEGTSQNYDGLILRFKQDGNLDSTFSGDGKQVSDIGTTNGVYFHNVHVMDNGNILSTGSTEGATMKSAYAMMLSDKGSPVFEFAKGGNVYHDLPIAVNSIVGNCFALQSDGNILLGGYLTSQDFKGENMFLLRMFNIKTTGFETRPSIREVKLYPNPTRGTFSLDLPANVKPEVVQVIDRNGRIVQNWQGPQTLYRLNPAMDNGIYFLRMISNDYIYQGKIQVLK